MSIADNEQSLLEFPEIQALKDVLLRIAPSREFCIAYSGGLDSRFLAFAAKHLGFEAHLLHIIGPQIAPDETALALKDAEALGYEPLLVPASSLSLPELARAGTQRCYVCKRHLFETLKDIARKMECEGPVCDGTNTSDLTVYRPGIQALEELHIFSPLAMAGISKQRIREIGRAVGFPNPARRLPRANSRRSQMLNSVLRTMPSAPVCAFASGCPTRRQRFCMLKKNRLMPYPMQTSSSRT